MKRRAAKRRGTFVGVVVFAAGSVALAERHPSPARARCAALRLAARFPVDVIGVGVASGAPVNHMERFGDATAQCLAGLLRLREWVCTAARPEHVIKAIDARLADGGALVALRDAISLYLRRAASK